MPLPAAFPTASAAQCTDQLTFIRRMFAGPDTAPGARPAPLVTGVSSSAVAYSTQKGARQAERILEAAYALSLIHI